MMKIGKGIVGSRDSWMDWK